MGEQHHTDAAEFARAWRDAADTPGFFEQWDVRQIVRDLYAELLAARAEIAELRAKANTLDWLMDETDTEPKP